MNLHALRELGVDQQVALLFVVLFGLLLLLSLALLVRTLRDDGRRGTICSRCGATCVPCGSARWCSGWRGCPGRWAPR